MGFLEGLPLSLFFPESDHIHFESLGTHKFKMWVLSILLIKGFHSASLVLGYAQKGEQKPQFVHIAPTNRGACLFSKYT